MATRITVSIVVVSAVIVAVIFISGLFSGEDDGLRRSFSDPEADRKKLPVVQLVGAARKRGDEPRAVISAEIASRFKPISRVS